MTRINCISVKDLCNQHLFAEWREMPRMVSYLNKSLNSKKGFKLEDIPPSYILGKGHIKFFYDKFEYLYMRHKSITKELIIRGYKLSQKDSDCFKTVPLQHFNNWTPTEEAMLLNKERIKERMPLNPKWGIKKP